MSCEWMEGDIVQFVYIYHMQFVLAWLFHPLPLPSPNLSLVWTINLTLGPNSTPRPYP